MPDHLCPEGACICTEYAEGAEHSAFHGPGQYGPEARKGCTRCLAETWDRFTKHAQDCSVVWECPEGWELYNAAVAANEEALR